MLRTLVTTVLLAASVAVAAPPAPASGRWTKKAEAGKPLWATLQTSEGDIIVQLFSKDAPRTVANFVGLATGERTWRHPVTGQEHEGKSLYEGTVFHRVIPGFMVQGGDPAGTGRGDPGYRFEDEPQSGRAFDKPGLLAMANAGPNTNGSQFFLTVSTPTWLTGKHTIFGEVVAGYPVVEKIAAVPRDRKDRPLTPVTLRRVILSERAPKGVPAAPATAQKKK